MGFKHRKFSLLSIIIGILLVPSLIGVAMMVFLSEGIHRTVLKREQSTADYLTSTMADYQGFLISDIEMVLVTLTQVPGFINAGIDSCSEQAQSIIERQGQMPVNFVSISRTRPDGVIDCSSGDAEEMINSYVGDQFYYRKIQEGASFAVDFAAGGDSGGPALIVAVPVEDDSQSRTGRLLLSSVHTEFIQLLMQQSRINPGAVILLTDSHGRILVSTESNESESIFRFNRSVDYTGDDGNALIETADETFYITYYRVPRTDLFVTRVLPMRDIGNNLRTDSIFWIAVVVFIGSILSLVGWLVHSMILSPLSEIIAATRRFAQRQDRVEFEENIVKEFDELTKSFTSMTRVIQRRTAALKRSNTQSERFAYAASHDLKEPLRTITSYVQLLKRRYDDKLDDDGQKFIEFAVDASARMKYRLEALLNYSRVSTRIKPLERTDVNRIVDEAIETLSEQIAETDAIVEAEDLPTLMAYDLHLIQLFRQSLSNAIKFRHPARTPHVRIWAEDEGEWWKFNISDNGIGIDQQHHKIIFEVFSRLHSRGEYSGSGIGLAIAKKIIEIYGGDIWVDSSSDEGTTFSFTYPKEIDPDEFTEPFLKERRSRDRINLI